MRGHTLGAFGLEHRREPRLSIWRIPGAGIVFVVDASHRDLMTGGTPNVNYSEQDTVLPSSIRHTSLFSSEYSHLRIQASAFNFDDEAAKHRPLRQTGLCMLDPVYFPAQSIPGPRRLGDRAS